MEQSKYEQFTNLPGTGNWRNMELHVGFKFSRAELMSEENAYLTGLYLATPEKTFEKAYAWTDTHESLNSWNDIFYKNLHLPEVNVVVSGRALHPMLPSKFGDTLGPWVDHSAEHPHRVGGDLDILHYMAVDKTTVIIQGDKLHDASPLVFMNKDDSLQSAFKDLKEELTRRAVRLCKLQEIQQQYSQIPGDAFEAFFYETLKQNDIRGMPINMSRLAEKYAEAYTQTHESDPSLTPEQLKYGTIVYVAGELAKNEFFKSNQHIHQDVLEAAIDSLEDANREAHYAQLTPNAVLTGVLKQLPEDVQKDFEDCWYSTQDEVKYLYPDKSEQWQTLTTTCRALQYLEDRIPKDLRYQLFHDNDMELRFVDSMEGEEHGAITPFD